MPIGREVRGACDLLGLDPLTIANEGQVLVFCRGADADRVLAAMKQHPLGTEARVIGEVSEKPQGWRCCARPSAANESSTCRPARICQGFVEIDNADNSTMETKESNVTKREFVTMDGNEAVAHVAYRTNEVIAIYPDHAVVADGRMGGRVGRAKASATSGARCRR